MLKSSPSYLNGSLAHMLRTNVQIQSGTLTCQKSSGLGAQPVHEGNQVHRGESANIHTYVIYWSSELCSTFRTLHSILYILGLVRQ
ncbi:hypothetical protein Lal_00020307, partial [Lupinus albus]